MSDPLLTYLRRTLPDEISDEVLQQLQHLEEGRYAVLLSNANVQRLAGHGTGNDGPPETWHEHLSKQLERSLDHHHNTKADVDSFNLALSAVGALQAFLQANVTGPPLDFSPSEKLFAFQVLKHFGGAEKLRSHLIAALSIDGEAPYRLTPHVELLCFAKIVLNHKRLHKVPGIQWARLRVNFVHQRVLSESSPTLEEAIYDDLDELDKVLGVCIEGRDADLIPAYLLEKAVIHTHHGLDTKAREVLDDVAQRRKFDFALTGLLGKRTRYQEKETSQLVVLAKTHDSTTNGTAKKPSGDGSGQAHDEGTAGERPQDLELNDDTILERISFTQSKPSTPSIIGNSDLPPPLTNLDPSDQPQLDSLDSTLLLALASSITNTRPNEGLTREETLPYAQRVLEGGSSNWQVYTQALLVRSRIEGYRSRTTERGLLQLQALVDQVISETTSPSTDDQSATDKGTSENTNETPTITLKDTPPGKLTTFLPRSTPSNSAPAATRLKYIYALSTPFRWSLEAELAARWTSLGGLRSALDIYERLEMWAEVALCYAAVERGDKATEILRDLLYESLPTASSATLSADEDEDDDQSRTRTTPPTTQTIETLPPEKRPPPPDAPRLHTILSDLTPIPTSSVTLSPYTLSPLTHPTIRLKIHHLHRALTLSNHRYTRASRSLGRLYYSLHLPKEAAQAYHASLKVNATDHSAWFALGCCLLEVRSWKGAREAFARVVSLDDTDAEGWSNLAAAVVGEWREWQQRRNQDDGMRMRTEVGPRGEVADDGPLVEESLEEGSEMARHGADEAPPDLQPALSALKRASALSHDNARIWSNLLTIAMTMEPPAWMDALVAQRRLIELRRGVEGEGCVDLGLMEGVAREVLCLPYFVNADDEVDAASAVGNVGIEADSKEVRHTGNASEGVEGRARRSPNPTLLRGLPRNFLTLLHTHITPLLTHSARLWRLIARVRLWQEDWTGTLEASEAGWRVVVSGAHAQGGQKKSGDALSVPLKGAGDESNGGQTGRGGDSGTFEEGNEKHWREVVDATLELVDGYESLAGRRREDGSEVLPDWRFKSRSAIRGVVGKGKAMWEGSEGFERLRERLEELKGR